eukprot:4519649-Pleurochrysis_carterae.AAC.1
MRSRGKPRYQRPPLLLLPCPPTRALINRLDCRPFPRLRATSHRSTRCLETFPRSNVPLTRPA